MRMPARLTSGEPLVSVVIPVWRDEEALSRALAHVRASARVEVLVACAGGEERRYERLRERYHGTKWISAPRGRAVQMNAGAAAARGRWLLFLHADSTLPDDWLDVLARADERADTVGGAFRLSIDSRAWQARVIEAGVRLRVALLGLPYGDQALFVRRKIFEQAGGYRDLPLMEDVDFVRRISRIGRIEPCRSPVLTSARRWERDGWFRRSRQNFRLVAQFLLGASPARLAQAYFRRKPHAVVMMARAPWTTGKTRLANLANEAAHAELREALFLDTLEAMRAVPGAEHVIACEPAHACEQMRELAGPGIDLIAQRGEDLGTRLAHAFEDVFRLGAESVVVIGSDLPDLPAGVIEASLARLRLRGDRIVLGPAADGGYYLIGMNRPCPAVFNGIAWSTERVLAQTVDAARAEGLDVALLDEWADIDDERDLERLKGHSSELTAARTRAWVCEHVRP